MPDMTTALAHEHEIAKSEDFIFAFQSIIRNTALLDRMLVSSETDYVIGGKVVAEPESMNLHVEPIWANGHGIDIPIYCDHNSDIITVEPAINDIRVDTVQVHGNMMDYDVTRRSFFNPELESGQYFMVPTKSRLAVECQIKTGVEGDEYAPYADTGWIKIAEIVVMPGVTALDPSDIKNITAIYQSEENIFWTSQKYRTFSLGSLNELKTMFGLEHTIDGAHRANVIKAGNILIGIGMEALKASILPLGEEFVGGDLEFLSTEIVTSAIKRTADAIKAHKDLTTAHQSTETPTANRIAMFTAGARLKSGGAPVEQNDVVRKAETDVMDNIIQDHTGKIITLWNAVFMNLTDNPFEMLFENLTGIIMEYGIWNEPQARVEC